MNRLVRFTPNDDLRRMQREFDRLFDSFVAPNRHSENGDAETAVWSPRVDLAESDDLYLIHLDVPGISKEDLHINYHDGTLAISGERKAAEREEQPNYVRVERQHGHFYRAFNLPKAVDSDQIEATYTDGVLDIRIPKSEAVKPRRIDVK